MAVDNFRVDVTCRCGSKAVISSYSEGFVKATLTAWLEQHGDCPHTIVGPFTRVVPKAG